MKIKQSIPLFITLGLSYSGRVLSTNDTQSTPSSSSGGTDHVVNVAKSGLTFDPPKIKAKKGDTVTFVYFQESVIQNTLLSPS